MKKEYKDKLREIGYGICEYFNTDGHKFIVTFHTLKGPFKEECICKYEVCGIFKPKLRIHFVIPCLYDKSFIEVYEMEDLDKQSESYFVSSYIKAIENFFKENKYKYAG